jgi:transposase
MARPLPAGLVECWCLNPRKRGSGTLKIGMVGIDLGKDLCSMAGRDERGAVVLRRRIKRESVLAFIAQMEVCTVAIEACCGAHHLGRQMSAQGHAVRPMSPEYVRPYVKAQKNEEREAEAIAETASATAPPRAPNDRKTPTPLACSC